MQAEFVVVAKNLKLLTEAQASQHMMLIKANEINRISYEALHIA